MDGQELNQLRDDAALHESTLFKYLYERIGTPKEILSFEQLAKVYCAAQVAEGAPCVVVKDTRGFRADEVTYKMLGGVSENLVANLLLLIDSSGNRVAISMRPDDEAFDDRMKRAYKGQPFSYGIAVKTLYDAIFSMYIEPLLVARLASHISSATSNASSEVAKESEARNLYRMLIDHGLKVRASDVHFVPASYGAIVKYRIDGVYNYYTTIQKDVLEKICNILKSDGKMATSKPYEPIDGKVRYSPSNKQVEGDEIDLRVSIIPAKGGTSLNIRYLSEKLFTFEELGMSPARIADYKYLLDMPSGLIVQVGPTGSGKSTTLYAGLSYVHQSMRNIITAEDPVEIMMDGITQIDVDHQNRLGFAEVLVACLRHDPDVIVVGELRDGETADIAIRGSNTGHLVLTSLHTNDSIGAFERLINMGVNPYSLGEAICAVMGQRLVRRLCPHCKQAYKLDLMSDEARKFHLPKRDERVTFYKPVGCAACRNTGYNGRIAVNEVLVVTPKIRELIQRHALRREYEDELRRNGFHSMYADAMDKAYAGITSLEELVKFAQDNIAFKG